MSQSNHRRDDQYHSQARTGGSGAPVHRRSRTRHRRSPLPFLLLIALVLIVAVAVHSLNKPSDPDTTPSGAIPSPDAEPTPSSGDPVSPSLPVKSTDIPWNLILVNKEHPLPEDYQLETVTLSNGLKYSAQAYDALQQMMDACRAAGLEPLVCSAYRSVERQTELFDNKVNSYLADGLSYEEAYAATATEIAIPGTSEHSTGLAADICALSYQLLDESQADTAEQKWLMAHCAEYGFILRFPKDKEDITGIIYEPWHYRYVGVEAAREITEQGLCLEEYMELYYELD